MVTPRRACLAAIVALAGLLTGCSSTIANQKPTGSRFPSVTGTSLSGEATKLPESLQGKVAVLLVGYTQRSQFDIDRWILGLVQLGSKATIIEVPTINGLVPGLFANRIDDGMRRGIPREDWDDVVTVYEQADSILQFLGNTSPNNARVLLLGKDGVVRWFSDRGYSASLVAKLHAEAKTLMAPQPAASRTRSDAPSPDTSDSGSASPTPSE